ncbi:sterol desaturase family protein, partial [Vibrio sp. 378]|nr:sterol desaturase family protein [Vibrio sp. 378]
MTENTFTDPSWLRLSCFIGVLLLCTLW